ncbi:MAG: hypothetical protein K0S08_1349 [Gammaproteobacteria bacterium]|jgi:hypothetical protein|nr:hypothetical protein [Gammaproteobacteria bacterium]
MKFFCCGKKLEQYRLPIINARVSLKDMKEIFQVKFSLASGEKYRFSLDRVLVQALKEILQNLTTDTASRQPLFAFLNDHGHHNCVDKLTLAYAQQHLLIDKHSTLAYRDSPVKFSSAGSNAAEVFSKALSVEKIELDAIDSLAKIQPPG